MGQREDGVQVARRQQLFAPRLEPALAGVGLTTWGSAGFYTSCRRWQGRWPQSEHSSRWPPRAAVRQRSIAESTLRCCPLSQPRLFSTKRSPAARNQIGHLQRRPLHLLPPGILLGRRGELQTVQWAGDSAEMARRQLQIAGCLFQIAMPQQQLNRAQIRSCFEQMRGEAVAQRVGMNRLVEAGPAGKLGGKRSRAH